MHTVYQNQRDLKAKPLSGEHARQLFEESGIDPAVAAERGYRTVRSASDLPPGFGENQRRTPALEIPVYSPDDTTTFSRIRPDKPRPAYKRSGGRWIQNGTVKYEQPKGQRIIPDVHPRNMERIRDAAVDLWVTEGEKKADSLTSRGLCTVALFGVDCWGKGGELLADWQHVALNGRNVYVVFDSDVMVKPEVQNALERLVGALEARGAEVKVVYLPGPEKGVDNHLVAGGTVEDLYSIARPFEKADYTRVRLSRSDRLRAAIENLRSTQEAMPGQRNADYTRREVYRVLVERAARNGKLTDDGNIRFHLSGNDGAMEAAISQPVFSRHTRGLEEDGYLRIERPKDSRKANRYVMLVKPRAVANMNERTSGRREGSGCLREEQNVPFALSSHRYSQVRAPSDAVPGLRWSRTVRSWRINEFGVRVCDADYQERLGKRRGAILHHLLASDGSSTVSGLTAMFAGASSRPRDFKRRVLSKMAGGDGGAPIIEIEGDVVRLADNWRDALEKARVDGQEQEAAEQQLLNYELKRAAFRQKDEVKPDPEPAMRPMDDMREPWGRHPTACACRECVKRFGRVVGEHVEDCRCGHCARDRRAQARKSKKATPRPVPIVSKPKPVEDDPSWLDHPLDCECPTCVAPITRYARPREVVAV